MFKEGRFTIATVETRKEPDPPSYGWVTNNLHLLSNHSLLRILHILSHFICTTTFKAGVIITQRRIKIVRFGVIKCLGHPTHK